MHIISIPVQWGDMDAYQHVNNAIFLKWLESSRIDLSKQYLTNETEFILANINIDYIKPVFFPDNIELTTSVVKIGNTSATLLTHFHSQSQKTGVATAQSVIVQFDYTLQKPKPWSESQRTVLAKIQA